MNRVKKSYYARYVDRAKLLDTLRRIYGADNFKLEFKEDHFVLTAPRELTEVGPGLIPRFKLPKKWRELSFEQEELEDCQFS
ncbi:hypothetical protein ABW21_db0201877 [Orbilia brochopaga]|nr:hypothetical protein ABW21_db0201877 [Drechslerella brochopaga]